MIVMTLNCRGLASTPKKLAIRRLIEDQFLDVIFVQETMCDGSLLVNALEIMLKEWKFVSVDAKGRSGGLLLGWRYRHLHMLNAWACCSGLCVSLFSIELKMNFCFLNLYGPYVDREVFWSNLVSLDCFKSSALIFGGDLNFSVGFSEIWGAKARVDTLSDFFTR